MPDPYYLASRSRVDGTVVDLPEARLSVGGGAPSITRPDGWRYYDHTNHVPYLRVNGAWVVVITSATGIVDHGGLGGLTDDDHTQYLLAAGTRALTGDWDNIGRRIRNTGVAEVSGTAPSTPATGVIWLDTSATATVPNRHSQRTVSSADTTTTDDDTVLCDTDSAAFTLSLVTAVGNAGLRHHIKNVGTSSNAATLDPNGSETVHALTVVSTVTLLDGEAVTLESDGSNWVVL